MSNYTYASEQVNGYTVRVVQDDNPDDPRNWDNLGHMCLLHRRYNLPWENPLVNPNSIWVTERTRSSAGYFETTEYEARNWDDVALALRQSVEGWKVKDEIAVILPVFMLDHGVLAFATPDNLRDFGSRDPFRHLYMGMDSGQVGFIYATRKEVLDSYGAKRLTQALLEKATALLRGEVEEYDRYHNGQAYGYIIEGEDGDFVDSAFGCNDVEECLREGVAYAAKLPALEEEEAL